MSIIKEDGTELSIVDKAIYAGIVYNMIYIAKNTDIPVKYKKPWVKMVRKLPKVKQEFVRDTLLGMIDKHYNTHVNKSFELAFVLATIVKWDIKTLNSIGFNVRSFLKLKSIREQHPGIEIRKNSADIVGSLEAGLEEYGMIVKKGFLKDGIDEASSVNITRTKQGYTNLDIRHKSKCFTPTIHVSDDTSLMCFTSTLVYIHKIGEKYHTNNIDIVGLGGELKSNMLLSAHVDNMSIGIKVMDDALYMFTTIVGSSEIGESKLILPPAMRYTLYLSKEGFIHITLWKDFKTPTETYRMQHVDLLTKGDIIPKHTKLYHEQIDENIIKKSGIKNVDAEKSFNIIDTDYYVMIKENGNAIGIDSTGRKANFFGSIDFVLNHKDTDETTERFYDSIKILIKEKS